MKSTIEIGNQTSLKTSMQNLFTAALEEGVFTGAAAGYIFNENKGKDEKIWTFGSTDISRENRITESTFFDLASLTKPLVTALALLVVMEETGVDLRTPLKTLLKHEMSSDMKEIQLAQLMNHSSGLPGYRPYYQELMSLPDLQDRKKRIVNRILMEKMQYPTGLYHVYSDLGYILLGRIVEEITESPLDIFWSERVLGPLGLKDKLLFNPDCAIQDNRRFAATEMCSWSGQMLRGRVHDENCRAMGGVAGHAGLFGTIEGVLQLCEHILLQFRGEEKHPAYSNENLRKILIKQKNTNWTCGFDSPSKEGSSSGKYFSNHSIGHLGFTGTSFWVDLTKNGCIVLLTNRVHPTRANEKIKGFRPTFHNAIMRHVLSNPRREWKKG